MPATLHTLPDDRAYGPGNEDYEYDLWRQRQVDEEPRLDPMTAWPFPRSES